MSKKPPPGKCIYCLNDFNKLTWDHVFPKSWYCGDALAEVKKWKVPACYQCNQAHGKNEKTILETVGLCLDPDDPQVGDIAKKALRAVKPEFGHTTEDKEHRKEKRRKTIEQIIKYDDVPTIGIFPNFGPARYDVPPYAAVPLHEDHIKILARKIAIGITYYSENRFVDDSYGLVVNICIEEKIRGLIDMYRKNGVLHAVPGINVYKLIANDNPHVQSFMILIWEKLRLFVSIFPKELAGPFPINK